MDLQARIDELRSVPIPDRKLLIDGTWVDGSGKPLTVYSPCNGKAITCIASAGNDDVDSAVAAARRAHEDGRWRKMPPARRREIMLDIADLIDRNALELAVTGVRDNGTEISMAMRAEPGSAAETFRYYAGAIERVSGEIAQSPSDILALVHAEPVGVVGAIVPWNFPLMIGSWKIAPALAAGNTIVLKPSETASLSLLRLAELALDAGLPAGVLNVVTGPGSSVGEALALNNNVDVLVFTGSGGVGRRLLRYSAASNLKRVYLELGGKSPNIIFADAPDLEHAAEVVANAIFRNSGQVCIAGSRLLVESTIRKQFVDMVTKHARDMRTGDPLVLETRIGAVSNRVQLESNLGFVDRAVRNGARLLCGGRRTRMESGGFYMEPTIVTNVGPTDEIVASEVFGPVLAVMGFSSEQEAVKLANDTIYGLSAGVWTTNLSRAHRMVNEIRAGQVFINGYGGAGSTVPLAGHRQSGSGSDKSMHALEKFLNLKTAWMKI